MEPKINIALKAARLAGKEISKFSRRKDKIKISEKGPTDFVTQVDKIAEKIIIETIKQSFPNSAFEGEELGKSGKEDAKLLWVIDPLDGTTNFIHGFPYYSVSIACYENGILEHGVVYDITRDDEYYASRGKGAYLNQSRTRVASLPSLRNSLICNSFHYSDELIPKMDQMKVIRNLYSQNLTLRRTGSTAIDLAYVASGKLDAFLGYGMKHWDFAAGALLVKESGGFVTDLFGDDNFTSSHHIVAANKKCNEIILNDILKDCFS
jgi:myo-inositol-1(or 4)-monophosphatase